MKKKDPFLDQSSSVLEPYDSLIRYQAYRELFDKHGYDDETDPIISFDFEDEYGMKGDD